MRLVVLPDYISRTERVADAWPYRLASWTAMLPITLASRAVEGSEARDAGASMTCDRATLALGSVLAVVLCTLALRALGSPVFRQPTVLALAVFVLLGGVSAVTLALQFRDAVVAERTFFAMIGRVDIPHKDAATIAGARDFVRRHPDSRWVGEALRIVAMAEWDAGRVETASGLWRTFAARFRDPNAPGVAYAEYSIALCDERLGQRRAARKHLRVAIDVIRRRRDGIQAWIASDAARRLSALNRSGGQLALAAYWKTKSRTFSDVYSTE